MEPSARVLKDSICAAGHRLTTLEAIMNRFTLAEFNTHRKFTRNSASSRAIPFNRQLDRVNSDIALPVIWAAEKPGMQGGDEIEMPEVATEVWKQARDAAVVQAQALAALGVHKSLCNRLLEPFMWHVVIVSATDWDGFWMQRCSPLAQPEIRATAEAMKAAYDASIPTELEHGQWHLPLVDEDEDLDVEVAKRCSVARVARVSRENHDTGTVDIAKDLTTYERLVAPGEGPPHASPLEHVATPCLHKINVKTGAYDPHLGNFTGWDQMRHQVLDF